MFSFLALLIFYAIRSTRYITRINQHFKLDVFDIDTLAPIARWSLSISLAFIGGIIISIVFQDVEGLKHWQTILIYAILVGIAVIVFFMSMWSTHAAIVRIKKREHAIVQQQLTTVCRKLKQDTLNDKRESNTSLLYEVAAWGLYENQIRQVKEWPLNAVIIGRLIFSAVAPAVVYIIRMVVGGASF